MYFEIILNKSKNTLRSPKRPFWNFTVRSGQTDGEVRRLAPSQSKCEPLSHWATEPYISVWNNRIFVVTSHSSFLPRPHVLGHQADRVRWLIISVLDNYLIRLIQTARSGVFAGRVKACWRRSKTRNVLWQGRHRITVTKYQHWQGEEPVRTAGPRQI